MTTYVGFEIEVEAIGSNSIHTNIKNLARDTRHITGIDQQYPDEYHEEKDKTTEGKWRFEYDNSVPRGAEFISPPLPIDEALEALAKFFSSMNLSECSTSNKCGLHMNISSDDMDIKGINLSSVIAEINYNLLYNLWKDRTKGNKYSLYLDDMLKADEKYLLSHFNAKGITSIKKRLDNFTKYLMSNRYNFINVRRFNRKNYFEIRIMGGTDYHKRFKDIETTVRHFEKVIKKAKKEATKKQYKTIMSYVSRLSKNDEVAVLTEYTFMNDLKDVQKNINSLKGLCKYNIKTLGEYIQKDSEFLSTLPWSRYRSMDNLEMVFRYFEGCNKYLDNSFYLFSSTEEYDKWRNCLRYMCYKFLYFTAGKEECVNYIKRLGIFITIPEDAPKKDVLWVMDCLKCFSPSVRKAAIDKLSPGLLKFLLKFKRKGMINFTKAALKEKQKN